MGCCISKCKPNKPSHSQEEEHQFNDDIQDTNLVISKPSPITIIPHHSSKKITPSPPSPTSSSTSSISSFTCTTTTSNNTLSYSSTSSLSSSASSALTSKDRSFSNEFLWSCYKDNPHINRINSLRETTTTLQFMQTKPNKAQPIRSIKPSSTKHGLTPMKLSPQQNVVGCSSMPQKRVRSNSPAYLTRQKSFRKHPNSYTGVVDQSARQLCLKKPEKSNIQSGVLGSPSTSRRFNINGDKYFGSSNHSVSQRIINSPKDSAAHCISSSIRKESFKAASPNNSSSRRFHNGLRHREICTAYRVGSKIDETVVNDVLSSNQDLDSMMEDIDNPLISLDCFIFL
ncbi:hypothetical protein RIF29_11636 [Crotalaria pallida]|uniref:Uncharacterized protein n=1 Tax=Crotalaria pallida TaxID=3830 RepID=A0AAN9IMD2_CROPI